MFLENILKEFKFDLEVQNYSPRTITGYVNGSRRFLDYLLQEYKIEELNEEDTDYSKIK